MFFKLSIRNLVIMGVEANRPMVTPSPSWIYHRYWLLPMLKNNPTLFSIYLHDPDIMVVVSIVKGVACWDAEGMVHSSDVEIGTSTPVPRCIKCVSVFSHNTPIALIHVHPNTGMNLGHNYQ